jgi:hypothetical protein
MNDLFSDYCSCSSRKISKKCVINALKRCPKSFRFMWLVKELQKEPEINNDYSLASQVAKQIMNRDLRGKEVTMFYISSISNLRKEINENR